MLRAEVSASLLLQPVPGDTVLIFEDGEGAFVLSVLSRERAAEEGVLRLPEKSALHVRELDLTASSLRVRSGDARLKASHLSMEGGVLSMRFATLSQIASRISQFARNLLFRSKSLEARCGSGNVNAGRIRLSATEDLRAEGTTIDLKAEASFRADGKSVHIG